jgi:hypothetical protein
VSVTAWSKAAPYLLWVGTLIAAGAWLHQREAKEEARSEVTNAELARLNAAVEASQRPNAQPAALDVDEKAVDRIVSGVVAAQNKVGGPGAALASPPPAPRSPPPPPTPEQRAAVDAAHQVLEEAIARGKLSLDDVAAMRSDLQHASPAGIAEMRRSTVVAINTRKVVPEDMRATMRALHP